MDVFNCRGSGLRPGELSRNLQSQNYLFLFVSKFFFVIVSSGSLTLRGAKFAGSGFTFLTPPFASSIFVLGLGPEYW
jgi:hypothetical protein